jgi:hypothetical protein
MVTDLKYVPGNSKELENKRVSRKAQSADEAESILHQA